MAFSEAQRRGFGSVLPLGFQPPTRNALTPPAETHEMASSDDAGGVAAMATSCVATSLVTSCSQPRRLRARL